MVKLEILFLLGAMVLLIGSVSYSVLNYDSDYHFGEGFSIPKETLNQMAEVVDTPEFMVCDFKNCLMIGNLNYEVSK